MEITLRPMVPTDWNEVATLIYRGTNAWYESHGQEAIFRGTEKSTLLFCEVYESLDPGCCILAIDEGTDTIAASCFYHPRDTHISLGIMNVHPGYFGAKLARRLLAHVVDIAESQDKPVRLVSSAQNIDSFSLYSRAGFVPTLVFQDMLLAVPETGMPGTVPGSECVRHATIQDVDAMAGLEFELCRISRAKDFRYFIENKHGIWRTMVYEDGSGRIDGFLTSVFHPASNMLGPGVSRTNEQMIALSHAQFDQRRGVSMLTLIPVEQSMMVQTFYDWGARNCEIHFAQVLGICPPIGGVVIPTFMPETG